MTIHLELTAGLSEEIHTNRIQSRAAKDLLQEVKELGGSLVPTHPGIEDVLLRRQFMIELPASESDSKQLIERLSSLSGVEAIYAKPQAFPPE